MPKPKRRAATELPNVQVGPPLHTIVIDNGGDSIRFGWSTDPTPQKIPNCTGRLPQQYWSVLSGDQILNLQNPNAAILSRSMERHVIYDLGTQMHVWKRALDLLKVVSPPSELSGFFGWNNNSSSNGGQTLASHCAVLIGLPAWMPRCILDQVLQLWWNEFGVPHVGFYISGTAAAVPTILENTAVPIACVVDMGWSGVSILPTFESKLICNTSSTPVMKRVGIGGRHMIQMYKYYFTYRQYNLMDQEWVLRDVFETTSRISLEFHSDMKMANGLKRPLYDLDYVLPDYETTKVGVVQVPESVRQQLERLAQNKSTDVDPEEEDDDEDDEDFQIDEDQMQDDVDEGIGDADMEDVAPDDEDEEDEKALRERVLAERRAEEERRRAQEAEQQVLKISLERFAIPEILFHPQDGGLPPDWANLPTAIVQAVESCPEVYRAGLYRSVQLAGGLSRLPNLKERLEREVRCLMSPEYELDIRLLENPTEAAWKGGCNIANTVEYSKWSVSQAVSNKAGSAWTKLLVSEGGYYT